MVELTNLLIGYIVGPRHYAKITDIQSDGKNIASADANGSIKYWDVTYKKLLHTLEEHKGN